VSESLLKGKPVIVYNVGGMPLQVKDGINAFVVPVGNTQQVAEHLFQLFTDEELYKRMSKAASETVNPDYFAIKNCLDWLFIANELVQKGKLETDMSNINDLLKNVSNS
jgi:glycosyltransferase involved in cell wall biosynthesis